MKLYLKSAHFSEHMTKLSNAKERDGVSLGCEIEMAASMWRLAVSVLPKGRIIPLLREGSSNRKVPGLK